MKEKQLENEGVILRGHFLLTSGLHSDTYFEKFRLLETPEILTELVKDVIENMEKIDVDYVVGPITGGMIVAYEFARQLKCKCAYLEKRENIMGLYRGTPLKAEHKVLIVDDVLTTGKSVFESIDAIRKYNNNIKAICVLINRSNNIKFEYPMYSAIKVNAVTHDKEHCPLCKENIPLIRPGGKR